MKFFIFFIFIFSTVFTLEFPEKFLGKWKVEKSENFDEYLSARGHSWVNRKIINAANFYKIFEKSDKPGRITIKIETTFNDVEWKDVPFDEEFIGDYLDDSEHKIKLYEKDGILYEQHDSVEKGASEPETFKHELTGPKSFILYLEANGVVAKRYYEKQE